MRCISVSALQVTAGKKSACVRNGDRYPEEYPDPNPNLAATSARYMLRN